MPNDVVGEEDAESDVHVVGEDDDVKVALRYHRGSQGNNTLCQC